MKKIAIALAAAAAILLGGASAAIAAPYTSGGTVSTSSSTVTAGGSVTITFTDGSFAPGESVLITVTGEGASSANLALLKAVVSSGSITKTASGTGAVSVVFTAPAGATGTYTITGVGLSSEASLTATVTVVPADVGGALGATGGDPSLLIWLGAGALGLGVIALIVTSTVRRSRLQDA